jgi:hypothetical protein
MLRILILFHADHYGSGSSALCDEQGFAGSGYTLDDAASILTEI